MDNIHPESHHIAKPSPVVFSGLSHRDKFLVGSDHMMRQCGAAIRGDQEEARFKSHIGVGARTLFLDGNRLSDFTDPTFALGAPYAKRAHRYVSDDLRCVTRLWASQQIHARMHRTRS